MKSVVVSIPAAKVTVQEQMISIANLLSVPSGLSPSWKVQWYFRPFPTGAPADIRPSNLKIKVSGGFNGAPVVKWGDAISGECSIGESFGVELYALPAPIDSLGAGEYWTPDGEMVVSCSPWEGSSDRRCWSVFFSTTTVERFEIARSSDCPVLDFNTVRTNLLPTETVTLSSGWHNSIVYGGIVNPVLPGPWNGIAKPVTANGAVIVYANS